MSVAITLKSYLDICRISNLPSVWSNVLCAFLLSTGSFTWPGYLVPALSMSCFYLAGMCLNDICDADHDAEHRPGRPIPSRAVSVRGATILTGTLALAGFGSLLRAPHLNALIAALLLAAMIIWYDLDHKQNPYSVLLMASCRFLLFVTTALAATGSIPAPVTLAGAAHFCYIVLLSLVARHENGRGIPFTVPVIPLMLAGIPLLDGIILAAVIAPPWLLAGAGASLLLLGGQKLVRGD